METQLEFWHQLGWDMVENTLGKDTEAGRVDERRLVAMMWVLGYHEHVTDSKYCGKCLVGENKWRSVKQPYKKQLCANRSGN